VGAGANMTGMPNGPARQDKVGQPTDLPDSRARPSSGHRSSPLRVVSRSSLALVLVALIALFTLLEPHTFPRWANFAAITSAAAPLVFLALAETTVLRAGDFDLSVSANMIVSGAVASLLVTHGTSVAVAIIAALAMSVGLGLANALLVVVFGLDSFIATLGSMTVATGLGFALTGSNVVSGYSGFLVTLARRQVFGLPAFVLYGWLAVLVFWLIFDWTVAGRQWLFIGGNREAGRLLGLRTTRLRVAAFVIAGLLSGLGGVLLAGDLGSLDPNSGGEYLLTPFAAAFLGTVAISVGRFNALGSLLGLYTLQVGEAGLALLGAPPWISNVFSGGTLLVAIGFAAATQHGPLPLKRLARAARRYQ
jgi:ribose transport system permease protein